MAITLQEACQRIAQEHPPTSDRDLTERDIYLRRIKEYNQPEKRPNNRTPCKFCGGRDNYISNSKGESIHLGSMMMVIAPGGQSKKYYHGLLVPCPACNHETTTFNVNAWWDEALPEVQRIYSQAAHRSYENVQGEESNG